MEMVLSWSLDGSAERAPARSTLGGFPMAQVVHGRRKYGLLTRWWQFSALPSPLISRPATLTSVENTCLGMKVIFGQTLGDSDDHSTEMVVIDGPRILVGISHVGRLCLAGLGFMVSQGWQLAVSTILLTLGINAVLLGHGGNGQLTSNTTRLFQRKRLRRRNTRTKNGLPVKKDSPWAGCDIKSSTECAVR